MPNEPVRRFYGHSVMLSEPVRSHVPVLCELCESMNLTLCEPDVKIYEFELSICSHLHATSHFIS